MTEFQREKLESFIQQASVFYELTSNGDPARIGAFSDSENSLKFKALRTSVLQFLTETYKSDDSFYRGIIANSRNYYKPEVSYLLDTINNVKKDLEAKAKYNIDEIKTIVASYINLERIKKLKELNGKFDFAKLARICEEVNSCYENGNYYAVGMLLRSIIDHVPPIFGFDSFKSVVANYSGSKSFKESMDSLDKSMRKIADSFLHQTIREKEILPVQESIEFKASFDNLISEIIRITEQKANKN